MPIYRGHSIFEASFEGLPLGTTEKGISVGPAPNLLNMGSRVQEYGSFVFSKDLNLSGVEKQVSAGMLFEPMEEDGTPRNMYHVRYTGWSHKVYDHHVWVGIVPSNFTYAAAGNAVHRVVPVPTHATRASGSWYYECDEIVTIKNRLGNTNSQPNNEDGFPCFGVSLFGMESHDQHWVRGNLSVHKLTSVYPVIDRRIQ